jgi:hypothetical protein
MNLGLKKNEPIMTITPRLFALGLAILFPITALVHGFLWVTQGASSPIAVYMLKIAFVPFFVCGILLDVDGAFSNKLKTSLSILCTFLFLIAFIVPFVMIDQELNTFFFVSDILGYFTTAGSLLIFIGLLQSGRMTPSQLFTINRAFLLAMSSMIIGYYFLSNGDKVSIPPEMHLAIVFYFSAFFFKLEDERSNSLIVTIIILAACGLSQFRMNIVVVGATAAICLARSVFISGRSVRPMRVVALIAVMALSFPIYGDAVIERLETFELATNVPASNADDVFADASINGRFVERAMVLKEFDFEPQLQIFGKGFGATYDNRYGQLATSGAEAHHVHSTPYVVILRHGYFGLLIYLIPLIGACISIFSKDDLLFRASLGVVLFYVALMADQYLYWGFNYASAIALWLYAKNRQSTVEK